MNIATRPRPPMPGTTAATPVTDHTAPAAGPGDRPATARRTTAEASTTLAVETEGLTKSYGQRRILSGLSLQVQQGEIFGILGPNGTGKTTSVEIIQGLRHRDGGTVRVLGHDPERERAALRSIIGSQLQSSQLPERMRVGEALRLFARLAGDVVDWRELRERWDLTRIERSAFGALSGGERQRLFVALALVNRPRVVFLDELTQGLDPAARRETWRLVGQVRDQGATVVLVTHYMDEAERLCDRVGVLHGGQLRACGTPAELVASVGGHFRTRFTGHRSSDLSGLDRLPGVVQVTHDGRDVEILGDARTGPLVAAELLRRDELPPDFTVSAPMLEDVFVALTESPSELEVSA